MRFLNWWPPVRRCGAPPPWRLAAHPTRRCTRPRGHTLNHADGQGYAWNDTQWTWVGPTVNLDDLYDPQRRTDPNPFREQP